MSNKKKKVNICLIQTCRISLSDLKSQAGRKASHQSEWITCFSERACKNITLGQWPDPFVWFEKDALTPRVKRDGRIAVISSTCAQYLSLQMICLQILEHLYCHFHFQMLWQHFLLYISLLWSHKQLWCNWNVLIELFMVLFHEMAWILLGTVGLHCPVNNY